MEALTPASPDSLPPIGELIADEPFWRYGWVQRPGEVLLICACGSPPVLSPVTWPSSPRPVPQPRSRNALGISGRRSPAGTGLPSCCSRITLHRRSGKAPRPWIWSASAPTAVRTGCVSGRPRRTALVTPGLSCGCPVTDIRLSASPRAGSAAARTGVTDCAAKSPWPRVPSSYR
jgi:hypothetical protein